MIRIKLCSFLILLCMIGAYHDGKAQQHYPKWKHFIGIKSTNTMAVEGDSLWVGTNVGLMKMNTQTGHKKLYNTTNSGLPGNFINSIAVDSNRNKWIGTDKGVVRYDGSRFTVYNEQNSKLSLNKVVTITVGQNGNKWAGLANGTIFKYDSAWQQVVTLGNQQPVKGLEITAIHVDTAGMKAFSFKIGGAGGGIIYRQGGQMKKLSFPMFNNDPPIRDMAFDNQGNLWAGTKRNGVIKYDGTEWTNYNQNNSKLPANQVNQVHIDNKGRQWFGTEAGLASFDNQQWLVYDTTNSPLEHNSIQAMVVDAQNSKWIGVNGQLMEYKAGWKPFPLPDHLPDRYVHAIAIDDKGNKYIGKFNARFQSTKNPALVTKLGSTGWQALKVQGSSPPSNTMGMAMDNQGNLWTINVLGKILGKYNGSQWRFFTASDMGFNPPLGIIEFVKASPNGGIWVGTRGSGLARYDGSTWKVFNASNSGLSTNDLTAMTIDQAGTIWIGTADNGLIKYDGIQWQTISVTSSGLPTNSVTALAIDSDGDKWIGTDKGLIQWDGNSWQIYTPASSGLPSDFVRTITFDEQKAHIWIGMGGVNKGGLSRFDGNSWKHFKTTNSGLPNPKVNVVKVDSSGNVWIGTHGGGLAVYGHNISHFKHFYNNETQDQTGIKKYKASQPELKIYPNPATRKVYLRSAANKHLKEYRLMDISGQVVQTGSLKNRSFINITSAPTGTYILKIQGEKQQFIKRVIKF